MATIINAAPFNYNLGTDDQSIRLVYPEPVKIGMHVPFFMHWALMGDDKKRPVSGADLVKLYGLDQIDVGHPMYHPAVKFIKDMMANGCVSMMFKRIRPTNSKFGSLVVYLDVLEDNVPKYKRHSDGRIVYDESGNPVEDDDSPIPGLRVKVITEWQSLDDKHSLGTLKPKDGTMTDADGNKSTMYPIIQYVSDSFGAYYNNFGIAFELDYKKDFDPSFLEETKALPYEFYVYTKDTNSNPVIVPNLYKSKHKTFVFKPDTRDPVTKLKIDLDNVLNSWFNTDDDTLPLEYPKFEQWYYKENMEKVLKLAVSKEAPYINADVETKEGTVNTSSWFDFIPSDNLDDQTWLLNIWNGFSTSRVPYFSVQIDKSAVTLADNQEEVTISYNLPLYLKGGSDGDLTIKDLEAKIRTELAKYLDENSEYMDTAINLENIMYDVGYSMDVKEDMVNFITLRKDTFVVLSTRDNSLGDKVLSLEDDRAIGIALKSRLSLAPESTEFGTPVVRAMVVMGAGKVKNSIDTNWYPLTYQIAIKSSRFMGGTEWKKANLFDRGETNIIDLMYDIQPGFIPNGVKPSLWSIGLVYAQPYDIKSYFFPALQTVYYNDTSVLNNYFVAMALTYIAKVSDQIWREMTGSISYTPDELIDEIEKRAAAKYVGKFADLIKVVPKAMITDYDALRGYSWTLVNELYANNSRTVMTTYTVARRMEDLQ